MIKGYIDITSLPWKNCNFWSRWESVLVVLHKFCAKYFRKARC